MATTEIVCPECGGVAHQMSYPPDDGFEPGDIVAFACEDCGHRLDVVFDEDDRAPGDGTGSSVHSP